MNQTHTRDGLETGGSEAFGYGLSIVVPTIGFNKHFDEAIGSALKFEMAEIIISLNGCDKHEFSESIHYENQSIVWIRAAEARKPLHESWNLAVSFASKYWVVVLSDDDVLLPSFLDDIQAQLVQEEALYYCRPKIIDDMSLEISEGKAPKENLLVGKAIGKAALRSKFLNHASTFVFPKHMWSSVGGFENVGYPNGYYVDTVFNLKLLSRAKKVYVDHRAGFARRFSTQQISAEFVIDPRVKRYLVSVVDTLWEDTHTRRLLTEKYRSRRGYLNYIAGVRFLTDWQKSLNPVYGAKRTLRLRLLLMAQLFWPLGAQMRFLILYGIISKRLNLSMISRSSNLRAKNFFSWLKPAHSTPIMKQLRAERRYRIVENSRKRLVELPTAEGGTCFIVGNGPSLTGEDLSKIRAYDSFASNKIHLIYSYTEWRPKYVSIVDKWALEEFLDFSHEYRVKEVFTTSKLDRAFSRAGSLCIVENIEDSFFIDGYRFSADATRGLYSSLTVTLFNIQLAASLGFTKIVLLGVDHKYVNEPSQEAEAMSQDMGNHFSPQYRRPGRTVGAAGIWQMRWGYVQAYRACQKMGITILNASRESELDVFPRIDLDDFIRNEKAQSKAR